MEIKAIVSGQKFVWSTRNPYPLKRTAFLWVEDASPIWNLTAKLLAEARPGSICKPVPLQSLYVMYPRSMARLPDWLASEKTAVVEDEDTHIWAEIVFEKCADFRILDQDQPMMIVADGTEWRLIVEEDVSCPRHVRNWQSILVDCGFGRMATRLRAADNKRDVR